jgi:hypothetical protein
MIPVKVSLWPRAYQPLLEQGVCHNIVALSITLKGIVKAKE